MTINPDAGKVVELIKASGRPPYPTVGHEAARQLYAASRAILQHDPAPVAETRDLAAKGPAGPIPLRLYRGTGTEPGKALPTLIYYHGGGWVLGDIASHDGVCRDLANAAKCAVISVDYRLAPEHKFPAAAEDAIAAAGWIVKNAASLGVDASRLAVAGDSAGGNLSALVAIHARDSGIFKLKLQALIYPSTDMTTAYPSYDTFAEQLPLTRETMDWFIGLYLGNRATDAQDWRASPLRAKSLEGVAPAFVITAGLDPLRDEGELFASRLRDAGVAVTTKRFEGQIHGFISMGKIVEDAHVCVRDVAAELRKVFG